MSQFSVYADNFKTPNEGLPMGYLNVTSDSVPASRRPQKRLASTALKIYSLGSTAASLRPRPGFLVWKETLGLVYVINKLWSN